MKKTILLLLVVGLSGCAQVTVDKRSLLHVGVSGLISFPAAVVLKKQQHLNGMSDTKIILFAGTVAMGPGIAKEYLMDAYPDYGDLAFDAIGSYGFAYLGLKTGQHFFVSKKDDTPVLNYIVRY